MRTNNLHLNLTSKHVIKIILIVEAKFVAFSLVMVAWKIQSQGWLIYSLMWNGLMQDIFLLDERPGRQTISHCIHLLFLVVLAILPVYRIEKEILLNAFLLSIIYSAAYAFMLSSGMASNLLHTLRLVDQNNAICVSTGLLLNILRHCIMELLYALLFLIIGSDFAVPMCVISIICFIFIYHYWGYGAVLEDLSLTILTNPKKTYTLSELTITHSSNPILGRIVFKDSNGHKVFCINAWFKNAIYAEYILKRKKYL